MLIKDMFIKPIDRDIKGVIKVGQADDENIKQELEEYVVTKELEQHFKDFFSSYKRGIEGYTDKMGVWISGFFGSGKSHFLKIISYLLENKKVDGKYAIDYFVEDNKITNPQVLEDMRLATGTPTDVVLFNIDSKSEMSGKHNKDAIVSVFLKVFNEMQGFHGSIPALADLERTLSEQGRYKEFKIKFENELGKSWIESRHQFDFIQDAIVDVLVDMDFMSEESARNWCEKAIEPYQISIEDFAKRVKEYVDNKGENHHLVFLVDEMGQYIGDDSKLMLNLQTVTEDLGTECGGKVWVIVTSQQDIDSVTKIKGNDFSKIQGRFDTRLSLSSANVDEVIKKRVLEKTATAEQTLKLVYEQKETILKNLLVFSGTVEQKLPENSEEFALVYPFLPYQFDRLGDVLNSIRTHGASGKHLSEGERSMLALFKESAMKVMNQEHGILVPFNVFYDALHQFLDHSHKGVISKAIENREINPELEEDCFNVNVLKTLFMIKYVDEIVPDIESITSLMVAEIDADRINLKAEVERALDILVKQNLVRREGNNYVFLTNEEQEINQKIENQTIEFTEITSKISEIVFADILSENKYRYPNHNGRYVFAFNQMVDHGQFGTSTADGIGVRIITPGSDYIDQENVTLLSSQEPEVFVLLPDQSGYMDEISRAIKINKYIRTDEYRKMAGPEKVYAELSTERSSSLSNAKILLSEALKQSTIYVNGSKAEIGSKDIKSRIEDALGLLVTKIYNKLDYITKAMNEDDIRELFKSTRQQSFDLKSVDEPNVHAVSDVNMFINRNSISHIKTSMKSLLDRFTKAPYGFVADDVRWIVAKLFVDDKISFFVNNEEVTLRNKNPEDFINYITKKAYENKLLTDIKKQVSFNQIKAVQEILKDLFHFKEIEDDPDILMDIFQSRCHTLITELRRFSDQTIGKYYPGKKIINNGISLIEPLMEINSPFDFFYSVNENQDDFLDFIEDYELVARFFKGDQKKSFETAIEAMAIYEESANYVNQEDLLTIVAEIKSILNKESPYADIPKLPELIEQYNVIYLAFLEMHAKPSLDAIEDARKRVFDVLTTKPYKDTLRDKYFQLFKKLKDKAETSNNVANLRGIILEADHLKTYLLNEMEKKDREIQQLLVEEERKRTKGQAEQKAKEQNISVDELDQEPKYVAPTPKKQKHISMKTLSSAISWHIESEQDLDEYIKDLRSKIIQELDADKILKIEL